MTEEKKARTMRLLAAITDALNGAPDEVFEAVTPELEEIADDWGLNEITENCETCWRPWSEYDCNVGEVACTCHPVEGDPTDEGIDAAASRR